MINVAIAGTQLVGYCIVSIEKLPPVYAIDKQAVLNDIYVDSAYRGKGTGRKFIELAEQWARKKRMKLFGLECDVHNTSAQAVYKKAGFKFFRYKMQKPLE